MTAASPRMSPRTGRLANTSTLSPLRRNTECNGHAHWIPASLQELKKAWPTTRLCLRGTERRSRAWDRIRGCLLLHSVSCQIFTIRLCSRDSETREMWNFIQEPVVQAAPPTAVRVLPGMTVPTVLSRNWPTYPRAERPGGQAG